MPLATREVPKTHEVEYHIVKLEPTSVVGRYCGSEIGFLDSFNGKLIQVGITKEEISIIVAEFNAILARHQVSRDFVVWPLIFSLVFDIVAIVACGAGIKDTGSKSGLVAAFFILGLVTLVGIALRQGGRASRFKQAQKDVQVFLQDVVAPRRTNVRWTFNVHQSRPGESYSTAVNTCLGSLIDRSVVFLGIDWSPESLRAARPSLKPPSRPSIIPPPPPPPRLPVDGGSGGVSPSQPPPPILLPPTTPKPARASIAAPPGKSAAMLAMATAAASTGLPPPPPGSGGGAGGDSDPSPVQPREAGGAAAAAAGGTATVVQVLPIVLPTDGTTTTVVIISNPMAAAAATAAPPAATA